MVSAKNAGTMTKEEQAEMQAAVRRFSIGGIPQKFEWSVELMGNVFTPECTVLDVAAGEGGLAMLFADKVKEVTCLDCEESAIAAAREACKEAQNISFKQGDAENMPFPDKHFDVVACRFAMHQIQYPLDVIEEMFRVCKPGGKVVIMDVVSPDMAKPAGRYNMMAKTRCDDHFMARTMHDLLELMRQAGLGDAKCEARKEVVMDLDEWLAQGKSSENRRGSVKEAVLEEFEGGKSTGLRPFLEGQKLACVHSHVVLVGTRPGAGDR